MEFCGKGLLATEVVKGVDKDVEWELVCSPQIDPAIKYQPYSTIIKIITRTTRFQSEDQPYLSWHATTQWRARRSPFIHSIHLIVLGAHTGHKTVHNLITQWQRTTIRDSHSDTNKEAITKYKLSSTQLTFPAQEASGYNYAWWHVRFFWRLLARHKLSSTHNCPESSVFWGAWRHVKKKNRL